MYSQETEETTSARTGTSGSGGVRPLHAPLALVNDEQMFEYYILTQPTTRDHYGLGMELGKLTIQDKALLDKRLTDPVKKGWLREVWKRNHMK